MLAQFSLATESTSPLEILENVFVFTLSNDKILKVNVLHADF